jgi:hypothetical protein
MKQAAITSNSMPAPALGVELFKRAATIKPARAAGEVNQHFHRFKLLK